MPHTFGRYDETMQDFAGMAAGRVTTSSHFNAAHDLLTLKTLLAVAALSTTLPVRSEPWSRLGHAHLLPPNGAIEFISPQSLHEFLSP